MSIMPRRQADQQELASVRAERAAHKWRSRTLCIIVCLSVLMSSVTTIQTMIEKMYNHHLPFRIFIIKLGQPFFEWFLQIGSFLGPFFYFDIACKPTPKRFKGRMLGFPETWKSLARRFPSLDRSGRWSFGVQRLELRDFRLRYGAFPTGDPIGAVPIRSLQCAPRAGGGRFFFLPALVPPPI